MKKASKAMLRLEQSRRDARAKFQDLRQSIDREVGWVPRQMWWLPVVGFACGLALSGALGKKRSRRAQTDA